MNVSYGNDKWSVGVNVQFSDILGIVSMLKGSSESKRREELEREFIEERNRMKAIKQMNKLRIKKAEQRTEDLRKEKEKDLLNVSSKFQKEKEEIQKEQEDVDKKYQNERSELTKQKNDKENLIKESQIQLDTITNKIEIINDEEQNEIKNAQSASDEFDWSVDEIKKEHLNQLKGKLTESLEKYCNEKVDKIQMNEIDSLIEDIFKIEELTRELNTKIKEIVEQKAFGLKNNLNHFNVVLSGKTGTGKSTLINAFLQLDGDKQAKVSDTKCETMECKAYTSDNLPTIRLWDGRGIELENFTAFKMVKTISKLVDEKALLNDPDQMIDAIWYCINGTGSRYEETEKHSFKTLIRKYNGEKMPIIVVLTKVEAGYEEEAEELAEYIRTETNDKFEVIAVEAKNELRGLNELLKTTMLKCAESVSPACLYSIQIQIDKELELLKGQITKTTQDAVHNKIEGISLEKTFDAMLPILSDIFKKFISINHGNSIDLRKSLQNIKKILNIFNTKALEFYDDFIKYMTNESSDAVVREIIQNQIDIQQKYKCAILTKSNKEQWKTTIIDKMVSQIIQPSKSQIFKSWAEHMTLSLIKRMEASFAKSILKSMEEMKSTLCEISQRGTNEATTNIINKTEKLKLKWK